MSDLPSTNDPIPSDRKVALVSVYQEHPLLKLLLENAQKAKAGDVVTAPIPPLRAITSDPTVTMNETSRTFYASVDTAGDKDETAVSVFEHDGNGNYRMVDTRPAELRPPPEHADKRLHWVSDPFGQRCVWE